MIANDRDCAVIAPPREDAPHAPPLMMRPLTLRAWPSCPRFEANDNTPQRIAADADVLLLEIEAPPETSPSRLPPFATAAYGLACAASLAIAVVYLIAR